jgi:pseudouridine kinase
MVSEEFSPYPEAPVLVIGASGIDIVGRLRSELHCETSNPARIRSSFGGVARNVAENLARLGQPVVLITALGQDQAGDQLLQQASQAGIDVSAVLRSDARPTGSYLGVLNAKGGLEFALDDMRVMSALSAAYLNEHATLFKEASLVFVDANLPKETLRKAVSLARRARLPICADPTSTTLAHRLKPYLSRLRLITPNSAEAGILCDRDVDAGSRGQATDAAKHLVSQGVEIAIISLAEFGVCYATSETSGRIPAIRTEIVDPTGVGDAMTAAVIFALLNEIPLDDAIRLGVSSASLTLRHTGAVLPDLTLQKLYDQLVI